MARPTVVLLHPFPLGPGAWSAQTAALEEAGWPVATPNVSGADAKSSHRESAERILEEVEGDLILVGASMGGQLAFELRRQAPDRIKALVLSGSRATPDNEEQRASRDGMIALLREQGIEGLAERMSGAGERVRSLLLEQPADGLIASLQAMRDRPDSRETLPAIDVPVLVLAGENDNVVPPAVSQEMLESLPNARYVELEGAGHMAPLDSPERFNRELLAFLATLE